MSLSVPPAESKMKKNKLVNNLDCQEPITATDGRSLLSVISYMYVYVIGELSLLNRTTKGSQRIISFIPN